MSMDINAPLFRQLERLESIDTSDTDALKAEIERAKAVKDIAETIIDTGREELPTLLLYGDSFSNPLECLLWRDFNVTYCVDFRYETEKTLDDYLEEYRPDVVLCVRDETTFLSADGNGTTGGET